MTPRDPTHRFVEASGLTWISRPALLLPLLLLIPVALGAQTVWETEAAHTTNNNVGHYSSLALDALGDPHVSYFDATGGFTNLLYAYKTGGVWVHENVDVTNGDVGRYSSLALDAGGNPHISYYDYDGGDRNLRYAYKAAGSWVYEIAHDSSNDVGSFCSLALDAQGTPHISYYDETFGSLLYAHKPDTAWVLENAHVSANDLGLHTSLELDDEGNPHVSYYDATPGFKNLLYAYKSGGVWVHENAHTPSDDVGWYSSLALDQHGKPHISYCNFTDGDLWYAHRAPTSVPSPARLGLLLEAYPNPFGELGTEVRFRIPEGESRSDLVVFDLAGRGITTLASGWIPSGERAVVWDGAGDNGRRVAAGVYFVKFQSGNRIETRQVTLIR